MMRDAISPVKLPMPTQWLATTQRPVLRTDARMVSISSGTSDRISTTSVETHAFSGELICGLESFLLF